MRPFIERLPGRDKESLKDVVQNPGIVVLGKWLREKAESLGKLSMQVDAPYEEVCRMRGQYNMIEQTLNFIKDAQKNLTNEKEFD